MESPTRKKVDRSPRSIKNEEKEKNKKVKITNKDMEFLLDHIENLKAELQLKNKIIENKEAAYDRLKERMMQERNNRVMMEIQHEAALACSLAASGDIASLRSMLLRGGDILKSNYDLQTPLHAAAMHKQREIVEFLLSVGARLNVRDARGRTPLDEAIIAGAKDIAVLIEIASAKQEKDEMYKVGDWHASLRRQRKPIEELLMEEYSKTLDLSVRNTQVHSKLTISSPPMFVHQEENATSPPGAMASKSSPVSSPLNMITEEDEKTQRVRSTYIGSPSKGKVSVKYGIIKKFQRPLSKFGNATTSLFHTLKSSRIEDAEEDEDVEEAGLVIPPEGPYEVVFGRKRGECMVCNGGCTCYQRDLEKACCVCGHFPASHQDLGEAPSSVRKQSILDGLQNLNIENNQSLAVLIPKTMDSTWPKVLNPSLGPLSEYEKEIRSSLENNRLEWIVHSSEVEFFSELGRGATAVVYFGKYKNKPVALKLVETTLPIHSKATSQMVEDVRKEFEILSSLANGSDHNVHLYGIITEPRICIIMEYCCGSLYKFLNESMEFDWYTLLNWFRDTIRGLLFLHSNGIVHRDLKTLNILLTEDRRAKLADFGLSRFYSQDNQLTTLQKLRGTYCYTAPEIYFKQTYTTKSDIYSCGVILWELCSRCLYNKYCRPYAEFPMITMDCQIIIKVAKDELRPTIPEALPSVLKSAISHMWSQSPDARPNTEQLVGLLDTMEMSYQKNKEEWDNLIQVEKAPELSFSSFILEPSHVKLEKVLSQTVTLSFEGKKTEKPPTLPILEAIATPPAKRKNGYIISAKSTSKQPKTSFLLSPSEPPSVLDEDTPSSYDARKKSKTRSLSLTTSPINLMTLDHSTSAKKPKSPKLLSPEPLSPHDRPSLKRTTKNIPISFSKKT